MGSKKMGTLETHRKDSLGQQNDMRYTISIFQPIVRFYPIISIEEAHALKAGEMAQCKGCDFFSQRLNFKHPHVVFHNFLQIPASGDPMPLASKGT